MSTQWGSHIVRTVPRGSVCYNNNFVIRFTEALARLTLARTSRVAEDQRLFQELVDQSEVFKHVIGK